MASLQNKCMLCPPLACNTARHISIPRSLHPGTAPEKPDRDRKRNSIKCPRSPTNIGTESEAISVKTAYAPDILYVGAQY